MATATIPAIAGLTFEQLQECLALGASLDHIAQLAEGGFGYEQIKQLAQTLGASVKSQSGGISVEDLKALMNAQRKAMRPENERHPGISAYSYPEGELKRPKPRLTRETIALGSRLREDDLTPTEIELCNRFQISKTARKGKWTATIRNIDGVERLTIWCADNNTMDGRAGLPPLSMILLELLDGAEATDPTTLATRVQQLEAQLRVMSGLTATA